MQFTSLAFSPPTIHEKTAGLQATDTGNIILIVLLVLFALLSGIAIGYVYFQRRSYRGILRNRPEKSNIGSKADFAITDRERQNAIYNLIISLSASLNYQRILDQILDLSGRILSDSRENIDTLVSAVFLFASNGGGNNHLVVGSARRFTPTDSHISLPGSEGIIHRVVDEGEAVLIHEIADDPELGRIVALRGCLSTYCLPLRASLETYGLLLFAHPTRDFFTSERIGILDIVCHQASVALQNARLYRELEQEKERILEIQEEARKKLARDLHDGPTQSVSAIAMRVNFARRLAERDMQAAQEELKKIEDLARTATKEIRHMLFTLRPLILESQGLIAALETMVAKMGEIYGQNVILNADSTVVDDLEMGKQAVIFYIVDEAVTNARKHAQAGHIWVNIRRSEPDMALLEIMDDGAGFNLENVVSMYDQRSSLGMVNMRERTELINGLFSIQSAEGNGTQIKVAIPLTETAAERIRNRS